MDNIQSHLVKTARWAGFWYLMLAITGVVGFMILHPKVFVSADSQKTLSNLIEFQMTARWRLLSELLIVLSQALTAFWFLRLFRTIDSWSATFIGIWGTVNAVIILGSAIAMGTLIELASSSTLSQQEKLFATSLLSKIISFAWALGGIFFGLWLFPLGYVAIVSKRLPYWLGVLLILGGTGYLFQTLAFAMEMKGAFLDYVVIPATVAEFWLIGYLLIFGIRSENRG